VDLERAAAGMLEVATSAMANAVRQVTLQRGLDPRDFLLVAYGGGGPAHAAAVARELSIGTVVIPEAPGHFSALGMLLADLRRDYVQTLFERLDDVSMPELEAQFQQLEAEGRAALERSGISTDLGQNVVFERAADMRYVGQEHPVTVQLPADVFRRRYAVALKRQFDEEHLRRYGTHAPAEPAEIVSLRATVTGVLKKPPLERIARGGRQAPASAKNGTRRAYFAELGKAVATPTFAREALRAGNAINGPALIEEHASTTVLLPDDRMRVDAFGNLVIEVARRRA
jgi:N-methylhydantoinase A